MTWPSANDRPQYAVHATETAAEAHAHSIVQSGTSRVATIFYCNPEELP